MDFLGSYIPPNPALFTPRDGNHEVFDDLPTPKAPADQQQLKPMQDGKFADVRQTRKEVEKRPTTVRFIAPLCEEEALASIKLTPRVVPEVAFESLEAEDRNAGMNTEAKPEQTTPELPGGKGSHVRIFGFKFRRSPSIQ